ncbi:MAG: TIGR01777 family protein [Chitinophagales bacterium]|nr:TIGR01777 family protein [Chitinophagales bacterium]
MSNILISGGSGMIGRHLISHFNDRGHKPAFLSRSGSIKGIDAKGFKWDPYNRSIDESAFRDTDVLVNLAGAGIADERWTEKRKLEIHDSRIKTTKFLAEYLKDQQIHLKTVVSASAIGYYGDSGDEMMTENDNAGNNFLSKVCEDWEQEALKFKDVCDNLIILRLGIVLAKEGGALPETLNKAFFGVASYLGDGSQYYSWIHIDDLSSMFSFVIENSISGTYNAVAPNPVTNKAFTRSIKQNSRKVIAALPAPGFAIRLVLGEMSTMVLDTQRCSSEKIEKSGFAFNYNDVDSALSDLL